MKVGILTYHFGTNFGGQLQCYSLFNVLKELGHNPIVINYNPSKSNVGFLNDFRHGLRIIKNERSINGMINGFNTILYSSKMRDNFKAYQKTYLKIGSKCSLEEISTKYSDLEAIIVGSDQVWAPAHHGNGAYFINVGKEFKGRRIAYAPCCAINKVDDINKNLIVNLLSKFDSLSARNNETFQFVKDLIGVDVPIVADPTLLCGFNNYKSSKTPKGKYILVYVLGNEIDGGHRNVIRKIEESYPDMPIYSISLTNSKPHYFSWATKNYYTLNPEDWVAFIKNASFLYTDSFHGVVFAMKFHKPFIAYYKEKIRASRFIDLKNRFELRNIINQISELKDVKSIQPNYEELDKKISDLKEFSINYLKEALS